MALKQVFITDAVKEAKVRCTVNYIEAFHVQRVQLFDTLEEAFAAGLEWMKESDETSEV